MSEKFGEGSRTLLDLERAAQVQRLARTTVLRPFFYPRLAFRLALSEKEMPGLPAPAFDGLHLPASFHIPWTDLGLTVRSLRSSLSDQAVWVALIVVLLASGVRPLGFLGRWFRPWRERWEYAEIEHPAPPVRSLPASDS